MEEIYLICIKICDIMVYNKKYIFGLHPIFFWHRAPKTLRISLRRDKGVFCYAPQVTFERHPKMKTGCQEDKPCD